MAGKVDGDKFNFYGVRRFFYFFSYFDALNATNLSDDLDNIQEWGFDGIRIIVDISSSNEQLRTVLEAAEDRGMIVDISFSYNNNNSYEEYKENISYVLQELIKWNLSREWIIDINSNHDLPSNIISKLRLVVLNYFGSSFPCTASTIGTDGYFHCITSASDGTNVIAPHFETSYYYTKEKVLDVKKCADGKPVYVQMPESYPTVQKAIYFYWDCDAALRGGAAGWCFNTQAGSDLKGKKLINNLYLVELEALQ